MDHLRRVLFAELGDELPSSCNVGYYEGRNHSKRWLTNDQDLIAMNAKFGRGEICLWCDGQQGEDRTSRDRSPSKKKSSKRDEKEKEVDEVFKDLKDKHGCKYSGPQLRLWARMITNGLHESLDDPPQVPMITGINKRQKQDSLSEALTGAALAFAKVITPPPSVSSRELPSSSNSTSINLSPCKAADLRMKHLEQLRYIQQLMEDRIISQSEFLEQKQVIIGSLRKIS